jgi:hypothetical protein
MAELSTYDNQTLVYLRHLFMGRRFESMDIPKLFDLYTFLSLYPRVRHACCGTITTTGWLHLRISSEESLPIVSPNKFHKRWSFGSSSGNGARGTSLHYDGLQLLYIRRKH